MKKSSKEKDSKSTSKPKTIKASIPKPLENSSPPPPRIIVVLEQASLDFSHAYKKGELLNS